MKINKYIGATVLGIDLLLQVTACSPKFKTGGIVKFETEGIYSCVHKTDSLNKNYIFSSKDKETMFYAGSSGTSIKFKDIKTGKIIKLYAPDKNFEYDISCIDTFKVDKNKL